MAHDIEQLKVQMKEKGYYVVNAEIPPPGIKDELLSAIKHLESKTTDDGATTHITCEDDRSFNAAYNYLFHGVNRPEIHTRIMGISEDALCYDRPRVVHHGASKRVSDCFIIGPPGHTHGKAFVLIRSLNGNGGFGLVRTEEVLERHDFQYDQVLVLPSHQEVRHLECSEVCSFVAMSYKSELKDVLSKNFVEEKKHVIPFMRDYA